jgi:hypothetical protein
MPLKIQQIPGFLSRLEDREVKTNSAYPFEFDLVTGEHRFKKTRRITLSDAERSALEKVEARLRKKAVQEAYAAPFADELYVPNAATKP